ncbi:hypothetical protein RR46_04808 [Papilio xuthus]|uniref:Uncharacterized protein n=1 Tax=Papilio xuthus TaxID=66420 RepID=A0A194Q498_PAPXU|nr:hypothetical protein RR46_04808 [Papilio xuthus]
MHVRVQLAYFENLNRAVSMRCVSLGRLTRANIYGVYFGRMFSHVGRYTSDSLPRSASVVYAQFQVLCAQ